MPRCLRRYDVASPACPPPMIATGTRSMSTPLFLMQCFAIHCSVTVLSAVIVYSRDGKSQVGRANSVSHASGAGDQAPDCTGCEEGVRGARLRNQQLGGGGQ